MLLHKSNLYKIKQWLFVSNHLFNHFPLLSYSYVIMLRNELLMHQKTCIWGLVILNCPWVWMCACVVVCHCVSPVMNWWRPGSILLSPYISWERLQHPCNPIRGLSDRKWMLRNVESYCSHKHGSNYSYERKSCKEMRPEWVTINLTSDSSKLKHALTSRPPYKTTLVSRTHAAWNMTNTNHRQHRQRGSAAPL